LLDAQIIGVDMTYPESRAELAGKVAVVVGGGGAIGAAITGALAQAGVDIACCDIDGATLSETTEAVRETGRTVLGRVLDATSPEELETFYAEVDATFDRLDILVNVVGGVRQRRFVDSTPEEWAGDIQRNYGYALHSIWHAARRMRTYGNGGSVISLTTIESHRGAPGFAVYAGAKAALTNFSRSLAVELGADRIRFNVVAPDTTPSPGNANTLPPEVVAEMATEPDLMAQAMKMYIPLGAPPTPQDIADAVLFLASGLSRSITGTTLHVDAGTYAAAGFIDWPLDGGHLPVATIPVLRRIFS
jgi:NAD(P)-dependent dehydrogenase (short-subunit alcohol dehydrogenase family)